MVIATYKDPHGKDVQPTFRPWGEVDRRKDPGKNQTNKMLLNLEPSPCSNPRLNADEMFHLGIVEHGEGEENQALPHLR